MAFTRGRRGRLESPDPYIERSGISPSPSTGLRGHRRPGALKRVTNVKRFIDSSGVFVEQPCQEIIYSYDSGGGGSNLAGRLATVTAKQCDGNISEYSEVYSYETWGGLQWRDSKWKRSGSTLTRRVDPDYNAMGLMTSFGYGTVGSLYSYAYTFDNAWRPATMTGEGLTLVSGVGYNAAGAMTAFTRDDGSGTAVNNSFNFNTLYQMTNQTVTKGGATLQNLTYTFSTTQNNGQILSQTDALSGETVEYAYDELNRLTSAATVGAGGWGLSWVYDGFGNREQQNVTKGSGPTHSVSVNKNNNRIDSAGYAYDPNGNMTTMPLMTVGYDVANRMVSSNHASAGTQAYGYNQANQRVFMRNGSTVTYMLYGLGGERLMEFQETCTTSCTGYTENQRWIYFAERKMFSKTGSTLKAITPNRLASEAKHFPYGETDGTPPSDTKDYFATYRRDGTGLDYAWNRYYSPTTGRFMTADPYGGSEKTHIPESWNRYSYALNDPLIGIDRTGLDRIDCSLVGCLEAPPEDGGGLLYVGRAPGLSFESILFEQQHNQRVQHAFQVNAINAQLAEMSFAEAQNYVQHLTESGFLQPGGTMTTVTVGESSTTFISLYPTEMNPEGFQNVYVTVDAPIPNTYTLWSVGVSVTYFRNFQTGNFCWGIGLGAGLPAHAGMSVGTIIGTANGRPPEESLEGVGSSLGAGGSLAGSPVPVGGHIFSNNILTPTNGAVGVAVGVESPSYSVGITGCWNDQDPSLYRQP